MSKNKPTMLEQVIVFLKSKTYKELQNLADETGVSYQSLISIRLGRIKQPSVNSVEAIRNKM